VWKDVLSKETPNNLTLTNVTDIQEVGTSNLLAVLLSLALSHKKQSFANKYKSSFS
jgi:hypothetical protein